MNISFDFAKTTGKIRAMHAVGQPPRLGISSDYMHYLKDANIPYSRLHDTGGPFGGGLYVDIPNIFRNFDADENNPESYDFAFTDLLLADLAKVNCEPIFRLGVTIENHQHIRAYNIYPPADFEKWARICEHIIRHYNEGWANGFSYGITYWEIWNEPDNGETNAVNMMWQGTAQQYYKLYETASKHLKKCFGDKIKVGGYASCGFYDVLKQPRKYGFDFEPTGTPNVRERYFMDFADGFFEHIKNTGSPIDFFSWHSYATVTQTEYMADYVEQLLEKWGYGGLETHLNEWNNASKVQLRGSSFAAANAAAMMIAMQHKKTHLLCYYDARIGQSVYGGLFNPLTYEPLCTYYSFKAFGELYALGNEVEADYKKGEGIYAVGATDGKTSAVLIANTGKSERLETNLSGMKVYLIDSEHAMTETDYDSADFALGENQTVFITNK